MIFWDEPKRLATLDKHGLDFAELDESFFLNAVVVPAKKGRFLAIGRHGQKAVVVVFTYLGREGISLVTMRPANKRESEALK